ncbi:MAG: hypothetical protein ACPHZB_07655, partial [Flavobacteriales bacterium]
ERLRPPHAAEAKVQIKWPNDILITQEGSSRKCAGMLVENVWRGASWSATVVGVGVNVNSERLAAQFHATSLRDAWGITLRPADVGQRLTRDLMAQLAHPMHPASVLRGFKGHLFGLDAERLFAVGDQTRKGVLSDVDEQGRAKFTWAELGQDEWLQSGDVRWRFEDAGQNRD